MYSTFEDDIEQVIEGQLKLSNSVFQVVRYYQTTSPEVLLDFVASKVKSRPAVFVRVTGMNAETTDTEGWLTTATYQLQLICAVNDAGKMRQISSERRSVNYLVTAVLQRLNGFKVNLMNQPDAVAALVSVQDLFTAEGVDARLINMEVRGVVIDMNETGLDSPLSNLLNG